jgi:hypothetical protein
MIDEKKYPKTAQLERLRIARAQERERKERERKALEKSAKKIAEAK